MTQYIILRHNFIIVAINWLSHNTMRAGDQKLMIDLEWPNLFVQRLQGQLIHCPLSIASYLVAIATLCSVHNYRYRIMMEDIILLQWMMHVHRR